jgi:hypothetical protein
MRLADLGGRATPVAPGNDDRGLDIILTRTRGGVGPIRTRLVARIGGDDAG